MRRINLQLRMTTLEKTDDPEQTMCEFFSLIPLNRATPCLRANVVRGRWLHPKTLTCPLFLFSSARRYENITQLRTGRPPGGVCFGEGCLVII